ncbi:MAG TPA: TIGR02186 family protein [Alphaproteobacteria bacterium]|nr:TIGR02186 family protein [Alphaproteobacteria bacterium]
MSRRPLLILGAALLGGGLLPALAALLWSLTARADTLVADLSSHLIAITTDFRGTEVVLFGAVDRPGGDIAVVVSGPRTEVTVRRKERVAGIWVNRQSQTFAGVPAFYTVATTRPLDQIVDPPVLIRHDIGLDYLVLRPVVEEGEEPDVAAIAEFREALIRNKQRDRLYPQRAGTVNFLGPQLFRTNIVFPTNVPVGQYFVDVYQLRDGDVVGAQTTPLVVSKAGVGAEIFEFAHRQPLAYAILAVAAAILSGWLAGVMFRKV